MHFFLIVDTENLEFEAINNLNLEASGGAGIAAEMLATTLGISIDSNLHWDERKEIWEMED